MLSRPPVRWRCQWLKPGVRRNQLQPCAKTARIGIVFFPGQCHVPVACLVIFLKHAKPVLIICSRIIPVSHLPCLTPLSTDNEYGTRVIGQVNTRKRGLRVTMARGGLTPTEQGK